MGLPVSEPRASRDWYTSNFGFVVEFEAPDVIAIRDDADFTFFLLRRAASRRALRFKWTSSK
jgi:hypothetical protein